MQLKANNVNLRNYEGVSETLGIAAAMLLDFWLRFYFSV